MVFEKVSFFIVCGSVLKWNHWYVFSRFKAPRSYHETLPIKPWTHIKPYYTPPLKFLKSLTPEKCVPLNFTGNTSEQLTPITSELISSSIDTFSHSQLPFPHLKFCLYQVQTETFQLTLHPTCEKWVVLPSLQTYQRQRFPKDIQLFWQAALTVCGEREREMKCPLRTQKQGLHHITVGLLDLSLPQAPWRLGYQALSVPKWMLNSPRQQKTPDLRVPLLGQLENQLCLSDWMR